MLIIDYHCGNPHSIKNMLKKIGVNSKISSEKEEIFNAEKLILPGVGAFDHGMENLNKEGLTEVIREKVLSFKTPILGICLGAQLMGVSSEEGNLNGLELVEMQVKRFEVNKMDESHKIPHMGWSEIDIKKKHPIINNLPVDPRFYFVHSYHFEMINSADILTTTTYGYEFTSSFQHENTFGVQFHPEKSHKYGMMLLKNFAENL